ARHRAGHRVRRRAPRGAGPLGLRDGRGRRRVGRRTRRRRARTRGRGARAGRRVPRLESRPDRVARSPGSRPMTMTSVHGVPTHALRGVLDTEIARRTGRRVIALERRPHPYRTSYPLEEITITLDDGTRLELVCKDLGFGGLDDPARVAKRAAVHDP